MIYGIIIEEGEEYFTYLKKLFSAIDNLQLNYKWFLSDYECHPSTPWIDDLLKDYYCILSGSELTNLVNTEDFQWIWGSFLAFDPSVSDDEILDYPFPECQLNEDYWKLPLSMQHPLAKIEIAAFDSSLTLIFTRDFSLFEKLKEAYPYAEDFEYYLEHKFGKE